MKKVTEIPPGYYDTAPNYTVERVDEISQSHACTWPACTAREWIGLTEDEAHVCFKSANVWHAVEAKLKEKNHG